MSKNEVDTGKCIAWLTDKEEEDMFIIKPGTGNCPYDLRIDRSEEWDCRSNYIDICCKYGYINQDCSKCKCSLQEEGIPVVIKKGINAFIEKGVNNEGVEYIEVKEILWNGKLKAPGTYFGSQVAIAWPPEEEELATAVRKLIYDIYNITVNKFVYWYEPTEEVLQDILECRAKYLEEEDNDG